mgnify:CR=1 FL=1
MDNKLLRHDLLHINEHLVTPRCCVDAGTEPVGRSLGNSHAVTLSQEEDLHATHHSNIQYFKHTISPPPGGGGDFRDSSGFAALRIDMNCVVSHNIKRRKRLLKQICRYSVGNLPTPAMTHANLSDRYGSIPLCERQPENRSRIPFRQQRKRIRPHRKTSSNYCECAGYTKKAATSERKYTAVTHNRRIMAKGRFSRSVLFLK